MKKYKQHKKHTIVEKNKIVNEYLYGHYSRQELLKVYDIPSNSVLNRWLKQYKQFGTCVDGRGKQATGRPKKHPLKLDELSKDELIQRIELLEDIKKCEWSLDTPRQKYQLIEQLSSSYPKQLLFEQLNCSSSGYYAWRNAGCPRYKRYAHQLAGLIRKIHQQIPEFGYRMIRLYLKTAYNLSTTDKIVYRLMKLMNIASVIRKKINRYPPLAKVYGKNHIKRDFTTTGSNQKWSIDISYIHLKHHTTYYLCAIKDLYDKSIISFQLSPKMNQDLVNQTLLSAIESTPFSKRKGLILHSDQGGQFTSGVYQRILNMNQITHSISYKGTCVDNAPIKSFFSTLKTGVNYAYQQMCPDDAYYLIYQYIHFYNNHRPQLNIKGLTPSSLRSLAL